MHARAMAMYGSVVAWSIFFLAMLKTLAVPPWRTGVADVVDTKL